jgi:A/G-specific adenine glycosylase
MDLPSVSGRATGRCSGTDHGHAGRGKCQGSAKAGSARGSPSPKWLAAAIERWFVEHARDLPWRRKRSGYRALVSECMLQQTQVSRVIERFEAFVARWPTAAALAAATEGEVLAMWQGLGYYRRARRLHEAAKDCVARFGGRVPARAGELVTLPGVGRYTAGAVASIVHGERAAIVDGNVARVLLRVHGRAVDPAARSTQDWLWLTAQELVERASNPATLNEGLMELGALTCTPRAPRCDACPWRTRCIAHRDGAVDRVPAIAPKAARPTVHWETVVMRDARGLVLEQRSDRGLWAGLWQSPTIEHTTADSVGAFDPHAAWPGVRGLVEAGAFTVVTSPRRVHFRVWVAKAPPRIARGWHRVPDDALAAHAMSNAMRRVLETAACVRPTAGARATRSRAAGDSRRTPAPAAAARPAARGRSSGRSRREG